MASERDQAHTTRESEPRRAQEPDRREGESSPWRPAELRPKQDVTMADDVASRDGDPEWVATERDAKTQPIGAPSDAKPAETEMPQRTQESSAESWAVPTPSHRRFPSARRDHVLSRDLPTQRIPVPEDDEPTQPIQPVRDDTPPPPPNSGPPGGGGGSGRGHSRRRGSLGGWAGVLLTVSLVGVSLFMLALMAGVVGYIYMAAQLPSPDELREQEPNFASSQIYDRNGRLLHEIIDPQAGKRTYVPISQISPYLQLATVATEDRNFYAHGGFDPIALIRALYYAFQEGEIVSGASTITQQVARNILLEPEEASERTVRRKIREIILATELTRRYSKDEILEIYVNNNNYGNLAYGVDAAARTYFGTSAANLTLAQASFLAGLPQSPATYDPFHGGREAALQRHKVVLSLMVEAGFITRDQAIAAAAEMDAYEFRPIFTDRIPAPHFVVYVTQWVEQYLGADALYTGSGLRIHTTLDPRLQGVAEEEVARGVQALADRNVTNGALVALEPSSGHILAMVGSVDFYDNELGGQVNVTLRCRQPGSAIKPMTYLAAFERDWTPATIVWDLPVTYTDTAGNVYEPVNFDGKFRGPAAVRTALANSLNIPAVKTLDYVTVDGLLEMAERLGATSLVSPQLECPDYPYDTRPFYGLALTLGGGEMKPLELTSAYATWANGGLRMAPTPILWVEDQQGNVLLDNRRRQGEQVVAAELAYLITDVLSDTEARCLVFSCPSVLELPDRPVAAKTGSTNDNRDAWTVGYTPDIAAGVWVGNNDNTSMDNVVGSSGAGPIWQAFMARAHEGLPVHAFPRPAGVVEREICTLSGAEPSPYCPEKRTEVFSVDNLPPKEDQAWLQEVEIDQHSGLLANEYCRSDVATKVALFLDRIEDPKGRDWMRGWADERSIMIAPEDECTSGERAPVVVITAPAPGVEVYQWVEIRGTVELEEFDRYEITYGLGENPQAWDWISGPHLAMVRDGVLGVWQIPRELAAGVYTLRVQAYNQRGARFEARLPVRVLAPTPTPTPSPTPTGTSTPTPSPTPSPTPTEVPATPAPTPEPETPEPSPTPTLSP
ncbi:MAG: transglycosylase domain-containing protein [Anaerolineae bacterium]